MSRLDRSSLVAGLVFVLVGVVLLLDRLEVLDVDFGGLWPLLAGAAGAILLADGIADRRRP